MTLEAVLVVAAALFGEEIDEAGDMVVVGVGEDDALEAPTGGGDGGQD